MAYFKFREEQDTYEMSFAPRLSSGETLSNPVITVFRAVLDEWVDVTAEVAGVAVLSGNAIQFVLVPAAADAQPAGLYLVVGKVTTSKDRELVGEVTLTIE